MAQLNEKEMHVVNMVIDAYVTVYGRNKWRSLTADQQHDVIMISINGMLSAITEMEQIVANR